MFRLFRLLTCALVLSLLVQTAAQANPTVAGMLNLRQSDAFQSMSQARQWLKPSSNLMSLTQNTTLEINLDQKRVVLAPASSTMLDMALDYLAETTKNASSPKTASVRSHTLAKTSGDENISRSSDRKGLLADTSVKKGELDEIIAPSTGMVPQPASMSLMGLGALALLTRPRKRRRK